MSTIAVITHPATRSPSAVDTTAARNSGTPIGIAQIRVRVAGEVDITSLESLSFALGHAAQLARETVIVDLREVGFLSIRAAVALGTAEATCRAAGVKLRVIAGPAPIERVLTLTGVLPAVHLDHSR
ncbi:MAG: STAS domain-containing protein, partial [Nocardia sp.]|nr:STAS domain-containing protein [Nocardia sp.]